MRQANWPRWARPSEIVDLTRLAAPIALSRASVMIMGLTDAIVLGRMAPGELAYVLSAWLPIGVLLGFGIGILLGVQVLTSELVGVGRGHESGRFVRRGLWHSLVLGGIGTLIIVPISGPLFNGLGFETHVAEGAAAVCRILAYGIIFHMVTIACSLYLEALRRPVIATVIMYVAVVVNLVLDLALVAGWWGFEPMGAEGVAWATTGTRVASAIILLIMVAALTPAFTRGPAAIAGESWRQIKVGIGSAIANIAEWGGFNFTYIIATWVSVATTAVYGLAVHVIGVTFMFFLGIGSATSVRVAEAWGRKDIQQVRDASRLGVVATIVVGAVLALLVFAMRDVLAAAMIRADDDLAGIDVVAVLSGLLAIAAAVLIFDGLQATASMALRAQDVVWAPAVIHLASYFAIMIPAAWLLGVHMERGAYGVMEGVLVASVFAGLAQTFWLEKKTAHRLKGAPQSLA